MNDSMNDSMKLQGAFDIIIKDAKSGQVLKREHIKNQLTNENQKLRDDQLMGTQIDKGYLRIQYFAFGTGTTQAKASDTALENEQFRKQVTSLTNPSIGVVESVVSLGTSEANFDIKEIGVFCGNASSTSGSGRLLARVNANIYKNDSLVVDIVRTDSCII